MDAWWKDFAQRVAGGPAAMDRVPASLAHVVEAVYVQTLSEARHRARQELSTTTQSHEREKMDLEVRSHVLSLREAELEERLRVSERKLLEAEGEARALTVMLRKEQASRLSVDERLKFTQAALEAATRRRRPMAIVRRVPRPKKRSTARARETHKKKGKRR
jgi:acyl-CoA thioesterase FadM